MTHKELREISLSFRRLSSNLLNSTESTASVIIQRFKTYIDGTPIIADIIKRAIDGIDYDYQECFRDHAHGGWSEISPPVDEKCHVKAMYDYLKVIVENGGNVLGVAMSYYHASGKFNDIIRRFLDAAFKPLIDYINDEISKEMILLEEEKAPTMTQNIETVWYRGKNIGKLCGTCCRKLSSCRRREYTRGHLRSQRYGRAADVYRPA